METASVDHETRANEADHAALKLWLRLLTCTNLIEGAVRQRLREGHSSTLPRFDLLAQLERHPHGLRMSELSRRLMVTGGNVTALAAQLAREGLITREADDDRRVTRLRLTALGRERFAEMARAHESWIIDLCDTLSRDEIHALFALLGKWKAGIRMQSAPLSRRRSSARITRRDATADTGIEHPSR